MANFAAIRQTVQRYRDLSIFNTAAVRYIEFLKMEILVYRLIARRTGSKCITVPNFVAIGHTVIDITIFSIFKMMAVRHLGVYKVGSFNGR